MKITLENQFISATIQSKGAELCSLQTLANYREFLWQADPVHWAKHAPVLFPIVGKLKQNTYHHEGKSYILPRHGFAREMDFLLLEQTKSKAVFQLSSSSKTKGLYPFDFDFRITYILDENNLHTSYTISNLGGDNMYYNVGAHPAFFLPLDFSAYSIVFPMDSTLITHELEDELISKITHEIQLENHILPLTYSLFEKDALIFKQLESNLVTICENERPFMQVSFADFPNLGIWTKPQAPFICIEPWLGYADTTDASGVLEEKDSIQSLAAGCSKTVQFSTSILA
ncbi:MAG: aldose 1-epimerase family protein [Flavobacterium sp.]|nr:aldose 1-epimerase family protein [Flavobacterium sp.]